MDTVTLIIHFFGGMLLANAIPHLVHGISGHRFQTPFASPPGKGESPPLVNVLWAAFNLGLGWHVIHIRRGFGSRAPEDKLAIALGALTIALLLAWWFGKVRGSGGVSGDLVGRSG